MSGESERIFAEKCLYIFYDPALILLQNFSKKKKNV